MKTMTIRFALVAALALALISCNSDGGGSKSAAELTSDGWGAFAGGNFSAARDDFEQAIVVDANFADAYNGSGWSNARLGVLGTAAARFTTGLTKSSSNNDMKGGFAFVLNAQKDYAQSAFYASAVITANASWTFAHDARFAAADLHLLLAEDYFSQPSPDFAASLAEVRILNPSFSADVSTVAGQTALGREIERLRGVV